ncbi:hypothetical protein KBB96_01195 [Luteolibacter ambystomatis]|uniref:Uncharacterized protein n=1 Tax=Luteolibacter ambystomatis TaxID=2824561 RepID=A0A975IZU9_9BACT|nr:hypothetical protein [Luteolibacter ambystomatis]QUE51523.1 hypothetical protein KBB96_01195 [Luteolibacter ambystomatis]
MSIAATPQRTSRRYVWLHVLYAAIGCGVVSVLFAQRAMRFHEGQILRGSHLDLASLIILPLIFLGLFACAILLLFGLYGIIRRRVGPGYLLILAAPFVLKFALSRIKLPTFADGVAHTLQERTVESELVALSKRVCVNKPKWTDDLLNPSLEETEAVFQILRKDPALAHLDFARSAPYVLVKDSTLLFEWGGPISERWGIAISSAARRRPVIPSHCIETKQVYSTVSVYLNPF